MFRFLLGKCWSIFATLVIAVAVILTIVRLYLPFTGNYLDDFSALVSSALGGQPVAIEGLEAEWVGLGPRLNLVNVKVLDKSGQNELILFSHASVGLDPLASLFNGEIILGNLTIEGVSLSVVRDETGRLTVEGVDAKRHGNDQFNDNTALIRWLLNQNRLQLESSNILWRDKSRKKEMLFQNVNLELLNDDDRHQLNGSATLPLALGKRFSFSIDIIGDVLDPGGWRGKGYLNGGGLHINQWVADKTFHNIYIDQGVAEVTLWSEWENAKLARVDGDVSVYGLSLVPGGSQKVSLNDSLSSKNDTPPQDKSKFERLPLFINEISGNFSLARIQSGWGIKISDFILDLGGKNWPSSELNFQLMDEENNRQFRFAASYLQLDELRDILLMSNMLDKDLFDIVRTIHPGGKLVNTVVGVDRPKEGSPSFRVQSEIEEFSSRPWKKIPGVDNFSGKVLANELSGLVDVDSRDVKLHFNNLFRHVLDIDRFKGQVNWQIGDMAWQAVVKDVEIENRDLLVRSDILFNKPAEGVSPFLKLYANFESKQGAVSQTSRYIPVGVTRKAVVDWLDRSIISGSIPYGAALFYGNIGEFPFDEGQGRFEVRFDVREGVLDFAPGWPSIEEIETEVVFAERKMDISASTGKSLGADLTKTRVRIENMAVKPALLEIVGNASGDTSIALDYLRQSPLNQKFGSYFADATATGSSKLELSIDLPLAKVHPEISGQLSFDDSGLMLANGEVDIRNINGRMGFTEKGISAKEISAKILGLDSRLNIATLQTDEKTETVFTASGSASDIQVKDIVDLPALNHIQGESTWKASLNLTPKNRSTAASADLVIESDLYGMAVNLPVPVGKPVEEQAPFLLKTKLPRSLDTPINIFYGDIFSGVFDVDDSFHLERGEINFSNKKAVLPEDDGLRIAGKIRSFDYAQWAPFIEEPRDDVDEASSGAGITMLDVYVNNALLFDRQLSEMHLVANRKQDYWDATIDSQEIRGGVKFPISSSYPLVMDLDYLHIQKVNGGSEENRVSPLRLPAAKIKSKQFTYDSIDFGGIELLVTKHEAGLHLDQLNLEAPEMTVNARGDWLEVNDEQYSSFTINFNSKDLGKALSRLGYAGGIKEGESDMHIVARWPGSPTKFALSRLNGNMHISARKGRLLDVEPGAGRIFGIISLQALPRRLTLDFSDIFRQGFSFDRIKGDFLIKDGEASTSNLTMDGPAAQIDARGSIDLAAREYDQQVTVVPHVTSSLPVAGAVAGGVGLGAAILLVQKLFEPKIDEITKVQYSVTGPWDNPDIKQLAPARNGK
ncbi:MAG: YhdP family protein [Gammaproteobacteria bacterium]